MKVTTSPSQSQHDRVFALLWYMFFGILHEIIHALTALVLGLGDDLDSPGIFLIRSALGRACTIPSLSQANAWEAGLIQHSAWVFSVTLALVLYLMTCCTTQRKGNNPCPMVAAAAAVTALEAVCTDLLAIGVVAGVSSATLFCGNFGVILLHPAWTNTPGDFGKTALDLLEKMIEVTMMRGAQTGGMVTWVNNNKSKNSSASCTPIRTRVVNAKRTDLSQELRKSLNKDICKSDRLQPSIRCLLGHTRFATSSKATMDGTHPHTWSPPESRRIYPTEDVKLWKSTSPIPLTRKESNYITHNGDLDFFKVNGHHNDLETVQKWLELATGHPMPATVDSAAIAGLVDILRTAGCFGLSLRYALLVGCKASSMKANSPLPAYQSYENLGREFETCLVEFCTKHSSNLIQIKKNTKSRRRFRDHVLSALPQSTCFQNSPLREYVVHGDKFVEEAPTSAAGAGGEYIPLRELVTTTIEAFFNNDLFGTTKMFMKDAVGSFGLMVTSSVEAQRQICIAARGQPMSIVFYPEKGIITYGSELAAVKAGLDFDAPDEIPEVKRDPNDGKFDVTKELCRFDLDDLGGEVVLVDFAEKAPDGRSIPKVTAHQESKTTGPNLKDRTTLLGQNEFLLPLTKTTEDPILSDIESIPFALDRVQTEWREGGVNRTTAWSLGRCLRRRLKDRMDGKIACHAATVDVLVTGCEVSLWLGEQFASDLQKAFPKLFIQATSSNKLLGVFGQQLAVPAIGFPMSEKVPDLKDTIVIIVSHSGGTFAPLAVSNLLQSMTRNIFVVSSEWDTQIGKQLRAMCAAEKEFLASRVFKLGLTKMDIALATVRPQFLCEKILGVIDEETVRQQSALAAKQGAKGPSRVQSLRQASFWKSSTDVDSDDDTKSLDRSSHSLKGLYLGLQEKRNRMLPTDPSTRSLVVSNDSAPEAPPSNRHHNKDEPPSKEMSPAFDTPPPPELSIQEQVLCGLIEENQKSHELRELFDKLDEDGSGTIDLDEFISAYEAVKSGTPREQVETIFYEADVDNSGALDFEEFTQIMEFSEMDVLRKIQQASLRDNRGLLQVQPSIESYFGESLSDSSLSSVGDFAKSQSQHFSMELYESRVASLQRFVAMCVMFHQTGKQVQDFFPKYSFGLMKYNMERTHSIMRIATTASPVSGDAVRDQMERLRLRSRFLGAAQKIEGAWKAADLQHMRKLKEKWYGAGRRHKLGKDMSSLNGSSMHSFAGVSGLDDSTSNHSLIATPLPSNLLRRGAHKRKESDVDPSNNSDDISC